MGEWERGDLVLPWEGKSEEVEWILREGKEGRKGRLVILKKKRNRREKERRRKLRFLRGKLKKKIGRGGLKLRKLDFLRKRRYSCIQEGLIPANYL